MKTSGTKIIKINTPHSQTRLSAGQKKFNTLIKKLGEHKKLLADWQMYISQCQQKKGEVLTPIHKNFIEYQAEMVILLDNLYAKEKLTKRQKEKIAYVITELCLELIFHGKREDMKTLHDKYSEESFDDMQAAEKEQSVSLLEEQFGVKIDADDIDFTDPMRTAARFAEKMQGQEQKLSSKRKKTAKQLAKEEKEQEEKIHLNKSIQAIYRQLVAALHPDREQDPVEHKRKTELMQKVTVAYSNEDLLQLLELQLAIEQIDQNSVNNIADGRLKYYNKILQNQLNELQAIIAVGEMHAKQLLDIPSLMPLIPEDLPEYLDMQIKELNKKIAVIQHDIKQFKIDIKNFKSWLNSYHIPEADPFDGFFI